MSNKILTDEDFKAKLDSLIAFREDNGRLPDAKNGPDERVQINWLKEQQTKRRAGELSPERLELLNERFPSSSSIFGKRLADLAEFFNSNGRLPITTIPEEKSLATWVINQRMKFKKGSLSAEHEKALRGVPGAMDTKSVESTDKMLKELSDWCEAHGRLPRTAPNWKATAISDEDKTEARLALWARNHLRTKHSSDKPEATARREAIKKIWEAFPSQAELKKLQKEAAQLTQEAS